MKNQARTAFLIILLAIASATHAAPADEVKALLDQGNAAGAYALGKKHPGQLGIPVFDFHFGVAAVDSGHAGEGVLALERYVVNFPGNRQARLELARGYFVLGEDLRAREEFSDILKTNPPAAVVATIDRYLDAIRARESSYKTTAGAFVEFGLGYDSNINGGVSNANVNLPTFGLVTIGAAGVKIDRRFAQALAGVNVMAPIAPGLAVFGSLAGDYKMHEGNREFDQGNLGASGGLSYLLEKDLYRATLSYSTLDVDYRRFRDVSALSGEWLRQLDELSGLNASLQFADLAYTGTNNVRNSRLYGLSIGYRRAFVRAWSPMATLTASYSVEDNRASRDDLGRDTYGLRLGVSANPAPRWSASAGTGIQSSRYAAHDALLVSTRRDSYLNLDAALAYAVNRQLSLRSELLLTKNRSNINLYDYRRDVIALKVRYEFK